MYYRIDDADGSELTTGLSEHEARATAQRMADSLGKTVYLSEDGDGADHDAEAEEFAPA